MRRRPPHGSLRDSIPAWTGFTRPTTSACGRSSALRPTSRAPPAYAQEDADREADLERAAIDRTEAPEDTRTSPAERHRAVDDGSARVWAAVAALGAEVERILFELSELEPDLIDGLRSTAEDADRRYREAVAAARAAHVEAVRAERAAGWIFRTVDGVGGALLASQPAPDLGSIDPSRSPRNPKAFERAWWDAPNRRADAQELHA